MAAVSPAQPLPMMTTLYIQLSLNIRFSAPPGRYNEEGIVTSRRFAIRSDEQAAKFKQPNWRQSLVPAALTQSIDAAILRDRHPLRRRDRRIRSRLIPSASTRRRRKPLRRCSEQPFRAVAPIAP